jgi:hypothetical protein
LRPNISVAVDGEVTPMGLLEGVGEQSEIHFVAAIKGGSVGRAFRPAVPLSSGSGRPAETPPQLKTPRPAHHKKYASP